jgi:Uma2 family endonuclease
MTTLTLNLGSVISLTHEAFYALCQANPDIQFERTAKGELIIVSPVGGISGKGEADLIGALWLWNQQTGLGVVFSSSTIFTLPNGADRSPDAAWVSSDRWEALTPQEQEKFPPLCPNFVIELRSPSDRLKSIQEKMQEYRDNGAQLGWLIDPQNQKVEIYRQGQSVEVLDFPTSLSGENVLPGFVLDLGRILA